MIPLGEALNGARFLASLTGFLRRPIKLAEARTARVGFHGRPR